MRTLDPAGKEIDRDEAWDLLPWYVNSTLSEVERRAVEEHLARDPALRAEMAAQTRLAEKVTRLDTLDVELERSLGAMRQRIRAETPQAGPPVAGRVAAAVRSFASLMRFDLRVVLPVGAAAAASLALVLALVPASEQEAPFRTLTAPANLPAGPLLRVKASGQATEPALRQLFSQHGLSIVAGPSTTGVYTLTLEPDADAKAVAAALATTPEIDFATVRPQP